MKTNLASFCANIFKPGLTEFLLASALSLAFSVLVQAQTITGQANTSVAANLRLSEKQRGETFDEVWQTINDKYYDAKFHGADWTAARKRFQARALKAVDDKDFYAV